MKVLQLQKVKVNLWKVLLGILLVSVCISCHSKDPDGKRKEIREYDEVLYELKKRYPDQTKIAYSESFEDYFLKDTSKHHSLFKILKNDEEKVYLRMASLTTIIEADIQSSVSKSAYRYALNLDKFQGYDQINQLAGLGINACFLLDDTILKKWFQIWKTMDWTPRSNLINVLHKCGLGSEIPKSYLLDAISVANSPRGRSLSILKEKDRLDPEYREALEKILVSDQIPPITKKQVQEVLDKFE